MPSSALAGVGGADYGAEVSYGIVLLKDGSYNRSAGHVLHELAKEGTLAVYAVELRSLGHAQAGQLHSYDAESSRVNVVENGTDVAVGHRVGLDHRKSAVRSAHDKLKLRS